MEDHKLEVSEKRVLRKIHESKKIGMLHNEGLSDLYRSLNVVN